ncbi:MAG: hypothetical protein AAGB35_01075 [Pseudomonadota bacterium]
MRHSIVQNLINISLFLIAINNAAYALGTPAGTVISNTVTVEYNQNGSPQTSTDTVVFSVQEIIDVNLVSQDASNVLVLTSSLDQVLTFLVTNIGNGIEEFSFAFDASPIGTDDFDPTNLRIFIDSNNNGVFDTGGIDVEHIPALNDVSLDANGVDSQVIFIVGDIPPALIDGDEGLIEITANATTAGAAGSTPGTILVGLGDGGVDALVGLTEASVDTPGTYEVASLIDVNITKNAQVIDDTAGGGSCTTAPCSPIPGAIIQYSLDVVASGIDTAANVVITDAIPTDTTYEPSSITLNGIPLTDSSVDADAGFIAANVITVNLGDLTNADNHTITFNVVIN